jgi:beta-galactosidase
MGCPTLSAEQCVDTHSDWYHFVTSPDTIGSSSAYLSGEDPAEVGPGFWELYPSDLDLAADALSTNAIRISMEWSRIFPSSTEGIDTIQALREAADLDAVQTYHEMFAAMRDRGITPVVILNHYSLPDWIHDGVGCHLDFTNCSPRGWVDSERTVAEIAKYAGFVAAEFGDQVDWWITTYGPFQIMFSGYLWPASEKSNPPSVVLRCAEAKIAFAGMIQAHARMYDAVKTHDQADADGDGQDSLVGMSYNSAWVRARNPKLELDAEAVGNIFYLWNTAFLDAMALGMLDDDLDGTAEYKEDLDNRTDFIGISYFNQIVVSGTEQPVFPDLSALTTFDPLTYEMEVHPEAFYDIVMHLHNRYRKPILVTGNGINDRDDGRASPFMVEHLQWLARAREDGAELLGYFYANLVDSYDWNLGTKRNFGLYAIDAEHPRKKRTPKESAGTYAAICKSGDIPIDLIEQYPIE